MTKSLKVLREQLGYRNFLFSRHDQALDQRIYYGAARHGPRLCTVVDGDVVVTEDFPHRHARHDIQTKVRSPFSDVARCCETQAAAAPPRTKAVIKRLPRGVLFSLRAMAAPRSPFAMPASLSGPLDSGVVEIGAPSRVTANQPVKGTPQAATHQSCY